MNIYSQVGLVTLVGLIAKNAILIVEFANKLQEQGKEKIDRDLGSRSRPFAPCVDDDHRDGRRSHAARFRYRCRRESA